MKKNCCIWLVLCSFPLISGFAAEKSVPAITSGADEVDPPGISVPVNQVLTPAGTQVDLGDTRPQVIALSPDGKFLVTGSRHSLVVIDPRTAKILQTVPMPRDNLKAEEPGAVSEQILHPDSSAEASYNGLVFSPGGRRIYMSNVKGDIKVFGVDSKSKVTPLHSLALPRTDLSERRTEIPTGLAVSSDGKILYVAGNLSNRILEIDTATGKTLRMFDVGALPYEVKIIGDKLYTSNWGGRRADAKSTNGPAGLGTLVRVDPVRYIANEGSVSVVNLKTGKLEKEIPAGVRACGMALSPDGQYLAVANAGSDSVTIIATKTDEVTETISLHWQPKDLFGASPNALVFDKTGKNLYVCNGTQNAVAVVEFRPGHSAMTGLIPTGWYPGAIAYAAKPEKLLVANIKGAGSGKHFAPGEQVKLNSHQFNGTLSLIPVPGKSRLVAYTKTVLANYGHAAMEAALQPARPNVKARPVPERVGEPSVFQHVIYIIKENRTYDQVLGDMKEGNGDPALCIFGEKITPNLHKLSREFVLLDNTLCSGVLSADGHQWTDSAFANDYIEKSFAGFPRSYPYFGDDAMAYSPAGFIWDNALAHGKTLRDYGEFTRDTTTWKDPKHKGSPNFLDCYRDFISQKGEVVVSSRPTVESLRPYLCTNTAGFKLNVSDVFRARIFIDEMKACARHEGGKQFPNLMILLLPSDHTSGTKPNSPTPAAKVADNDLAVGQIVEAVSHSEFWKDTCIFAIEDDPQAGFDHVSSYRTTAYVASPYTRRHAVIHTAYTQPSLVRTMELILGLPPMNQFDASATPMTDCFTDEPDFAPFDSTPNLVPLDQMNPGVASIKDPLQKKFAIASKKLPLDDADECPEDLFNRILWNAQMGSTAKYPAWAVTVIKNTKRD